MSRLPVSEVAARHLDKWLDQLMRGVLRLGELPLPVEAFYHAGYLDGMAHAAAQARDYEHKLYLAYIAAYSPKDRREEYQRRMDEYFAAESERFFTEPQHSGPALLERKVA